MKLKIVSTINPHRFHHCYETLQHWSSFAQVIEIVLLQDKKEIPALQRKLVDKGHYLKRSLAPISLASVTTTCPNNSRWPKTKKLLSLEQLLCYFSSSKNLAPDDDILFVNSDVRIESAVFFDSLFPNDHSFLFLHRTDCFCGKKLGAYTHGVDAIFVPSYLRREIPLSKSLKRYFVGAPGWDHYLPLYLSAKSFRVKIRHSPFLLHEVHNTSYPGYYTFFVLQLVVDIIALPLPSIPFSIFTPFIAFLSGLSDDSVISSILHKIFVFPALRSIGWQITRKTHDSSKS